MPPGKAFLKRGLARDVESILSKSDEYQQKKARRFPCLQSMLKKLMGDYGGEMQMPADKLLAGQAFAYAFGVPTLLLYLLDDCLVTQRVVAGNGDKMNVTRELYEQSNRTIEGGTIQRKNCYISIEGAETIRIGL